MESLILNLAPTGMIPTKDQTPHVPITPDEIADTIYQLKDYISIAHLHAREENGVPTYKKNIYAEIIDKVRTKCGPDIIICVSTSGRNFKEFEKRSEVLELTGDLKPDSASLTLSSLNFTRSSSMNAPQMVKDLAKKMLDNGIKPELEVFDPGMVNFGVYLIKKGIVKPPYYWNLFLGNTCSIQSDLLSAGYIKNLLPENSICAFGGIGRFQLKTNVMAILECDGVRVGVEDNIFYDSDRKKLATNQELVERILKIAKLYERPIASSQETRRRLNLL